MSNLKIEWHNLHDAFQNNIAATKFFLCNENGRVLKISRNDPKIETLRGNSTSYTEIGQVPPHIQYQWLDQFIDTVEETNLQNNMLTAINGKGAFRRFKDILNDLPEHRKAWFNFRDMAVREYIEDWVKELGITATNAPLWHQQKPEEHTEDQRKTDKPATENPLASFIKEWLDTTPLERSNTADAAKILATKITQRFNIPF